MQPLAGFRVLDLTRFLAGPYCTMVLAELGADVIKIEQPGSGDDARRLDPKINGESYPFAMANRSKRGLALDLKAPAGKAVFMKMAESADLVIENFRPGVVAALGIGYDEVRAINPSVLYCSISGFGQTGPYRDRAGFDIIAQGYIGIMRMTGAPGGGPAKVGVAFNDIAAGSTAIYSIMAAEMSRRLTGRGQYIDISIVEAGLAWTIWESGAFFGAGEVPQQMGTRHRRSAPYQAFRTSDGYVTIGAANDRLWRRLVAEVFEQPAWAEDPRFETSEARLEHVDELEETIEARTVHASTDHWIEKLRQAGVPAGPVLRYDQTFDDAHLQERGMIVELDHPLIGPMKTIGSATKFSEIDYSVRSPAPWLGQHSAEILAAEGLSSEEIERLFAAGVVYDSQRTAEAAV
jgi:crotonobetainyl-CoA:carnitine CoA-transferase CaiB-like acyl-CoA transferase